MCMDVTAIKSERSPVDEVFANEVHLRDGGHVNLHQPLANPPGQVGGRPQGGSRTQRHSPEHRGPSAWVNQSMELLNRIHLDARHLHHYEAHAREKSVNLLLRNYHVI